MMKKVYGVTQINRYIRNMFAQDFVLHQVCVKGEVSNCKYHSSGHIYLTLKENNSAISAIMFAGNRGGLSFRMKDGDKVEVTGSIEVFERDGRYQIYAKEITLAGAGDLYARFLQLKQELEEMGMFAEEYKKPIPQYAGRIGIVTAPTGAAIQDIRNIAARRNPYVQLILYPALVHGVGYVLNVHEGPNSFHWKQYPGRTAERVIEEGMVTTDEPGIYLEGKFGIRTENELICRKGEKNEYASLCILRI